MSTETVQTAAKRQVGHRAGTRPPRGPVHSSLRRLALISAVLLALVPATLLAQSTAPATGPASGFASGGLGLTRAEWEARVGPGEAGQGAEWYRVNGLLLNVLFDPDSNGRIYSIDWHAPAKAGVPLDQATMPLRTAQAEIARFLPADAVLRENFDAPGSGIHPSFAARSALPQRCPRRCLLE